ncbi:MAG: UDP-glucose 4-epimerase, partial [Chlamydiales bacterium]
MQQKTILVIGGAGYIGSHVNKVLHHEGFRTVIFDNLSRGHLDVIINGDFVQGDTSNQEDLDRVFASYKIDAVMHFAAHIAVGESVSDPSKYYRNNVSNTLNLLDAMLRHGV